MKKYRLKNGRPACRTPLKEQDGFALLISLVVIFLLVVVILESDFQARADLRAAGNFRDDLKAFYLVQSAVTAGKALIRDDTKNSNAYDSLDELWAFPIPDYPLGDGVINGLIVDEERKINLNKLLPPPNVSGIQNVSPGRRDQLTRLFELLEIDPDVVDPIIDWLDADSEALPFGAEEETYQLRDPPYAPRNGPLETLRELHMVHGITPEIYRKITPYLTIYGSGKVNVNTADTLVLQSFDEGIDETEARRIMEKRPFEKLQGERSFPNHIQKQLSGVYQAMFKAGSLNWITNRSDSFLLTAEGRVGNTRKTAHAVVERNGKFHYFRID
ncbi:MAG: type II secretion system minor pseudopilin GspK [Nitrospiria bacterium]